jgi:hypothetical protein
VTLKVWSAKNRDVNPNGQRKGPKSWEPSGVRGVEGRPGGRKMEHTSRHLKRNSTNLSTVLLLLCPIEMVEGHWTAGTMFRPRSENLPRNVHDVMQRNTRIGWFSCSVLGKSRVRFSSILTCPVSFCPCLYTSRQDSKLDRTTFIPH